ncbi:MAG: hypothetical protein ABSC72_11130 [Methylovirgula sp.]|jgi:hypothetical protein
MNRPDPAAHLADMIVRYGAPRKSSIAMLWAYFDETVVNELDATDGKRRPVDMLVGGCIAPAEQWEAFSDKWKKALADEGIGTFHATDFYAFRREFSWFKDGEKDLARHSAFRDRLSDIIIEHVDGAITFASMLSVTEKGIRRAYEDAVMRAIYDFTKVCRPEDDLNIILARHPELTPWAILHTFERINWENRISGCGIFYPHQVIPLQAADFVLHSINKRWEGLETRSFERLREGFGKRNKSFISQLASTVDVSGFSRPKPQKKCAPPS